MAWTKPQYGKGEIDRAGAMLISVSLTEPEDWQRGLAIINNWRSSHSYPLQALKMTLRSRARKVEPGALVAQRLKRLSSIEIKLQRNSNMALSQMQDLGGARAVLRSGAEVDRLVEVYKSADAKNPSGRAEFVKKYDYIRNPKADGYRGVHLIYKYRSSAAHKQAWNGLRIEIQLRSRRQHAWATAVETVDTLLSQSLKTGGGTDTWRRFFALMGTAISLREGTPSVPDTPSGGELVAELRSLNQQLEVERTLTALGVGVVGTKGPKLDQAFFLLELEPQAKSLRVTSYPQSESAKASQAYLAAEERLHGNGNAVLVSVEDVAALRRAYPNYFLDTKIFVDTLRTVLAQ